MAVSPISLRRWGAPVVAAWVAASGCTAILGITDVGPDPGNGGGGAGGTTTTGVGGMTTTTGAGGTTTTGAGGMTTTSAGGAGGQATGDFELVLSAPSFDAPLDGHAMLHVEIMPNGGFSGAIDVAADAPIDGLDVQGTQIPAGSTKGVVLVGVTAPFTLGQSFSLKLKATSGALTHTAEVPATVTGKPGTLDTSFATNGVTSWPVETKFGSLSSLQVVSNGILVAGAHKTDQGAISMFGARLAQGGGLDATFNPGDVVPGLVRPVFCSCGSMYPEQARHAFRFAADEVLLVGSASRADKTQYDITLARFTDGGDPKDVNGDKGLARIDIGDGYDDFVTAAALAAGPRLVIVGEWSGPGANFMFATRLNDDNSGLDPNFANSGRALWQGRTPLGVMIDSMDRTLVLSTENNSWHVDRLTPSGIDDVQAVHAIGNTGVPIGAALLPNDGLVVVTLAVDFAGTSFALWFLDPDLSLTDLSSGQNPGLYDPTPAMIDDPVAVAVLPDGRVLVLGTHGGGGSYLARILPDGTPDPTFGGGDGFADISLGPSTLLQTMTVLPDGKVLVGGTTADLPPQFVVGRVWN